MHWRAGITLYKLENNQTLSELKLQPKTAIFQLKGEIRHQAKLILLSFADCKADSVYTILIQFPASSLPDTGGDTTSITMLSDTETPGTQAGEDTAR